MKMHTIFALFDKADEVRITREGLLRELARNTPSTQDDSLAMAESAVVVAALRRLAASSSN